MIQNERPERKFDSKVDSDDSVVASRQDAADFIDSIGQEQTRKAMRAHRIYRSFAP